MKLLVNLTVVFSLVSCAGSPSVSDPERRPELTKSEPETSPETARPNPGTKQFWDNAYDRDVYVFGTEPNRYFQKILSELPKGTVLLPGEGEGRNAVWAAKEGWTVDAFDFSPKAKEKSDRLAEKAGVVVNYWVADFAKPKLAKQYDVIAIVYLHLSPSVFVPGMVEMLSHLKPGGTLLMEVFAEGHEKTGAKFGPKSLDVLYSTEEIKASISGLDIAQLEVVEITLNEGKHQGHGLVLRLRATRRK